MDGITFTTIDSRFLKVLPNYISSNFKYIFPRRGPGIHTDMVKALSCFTDKHVLFGAFADYVNNLQWENYYEQSNLYYAMLNKWIEKWDTFGEITDSGHVQKFPLGYTKYNGQPFHPYSAFGEEGYHHGLLMTTAYAKNIFLEMEESKQGEYIQNSFQAWHDDGMTVDDTHKITKKYL